MMLLLKCLLAFLLFAILIAAVHEGAIWFRVWRGPRKKSEEAIDARFRWNSAAGGYVWTPDPARFTGGAKRNGRPDT